MKPIYYHVFISSVALEIFPSWGRFENFSFHKTFYGRQSCKFCTIHHLQFDHLIICVASVNSDSSTQSCNAIPIGAATAWGGPGLMEIPQDIITSYVISAREVRELIEKSMKPWMFSDHLWVPCKYNIHCNLTRAQHFSSQANISYLIVQRE